MSGEIFEQLFIYEAMSRGLSVSRPVNTTQYDALVDNGSQVLKIQIKSSTNLKCGSSYGVNLSRGYRSKDKYKKGEVDYFAVYIVPSGTWYIIPFCDVEGLTKINVTDNAAETKYSGFKGAWALLMRPGLSL